jgi:hypothetical protein
MYLKEEGIRIEVQKELMLNMLQAHASLGKVEMVESAKKDIIKFLFPEMKDQEQKMMEEARERLQNSNPILRIGASSDKKLDPTIANQMLNR